jgi:tRNA pseudouridine38-40 synthase
MRNRAWRVEERLNHELLREEADALVGRHDFRAFRTSSDWRVDTVRNVFRIDVNVGAPDRRCVALEIRGDRFLHRMVRIITGTLVDVSRGRLEKGAVKRAFSSGQRNDLGITAPPDGLYLVEIDLDDEGSDNWPDHLSSR